MPQKPSWFGTSHSRTSSNVPLLSLYLAPIQPATLLIAQKYLPIGEVVVINSLSSYVDFTYSILDEIALFLCVASKNITELTMALFTPVIVGFIY